MTKILLALLAALTPGPQDAPPPVSGPASGPASEPASRPAPGDVVVTGRVKRGSAIDVAAPIAVLDQAAIRALGVNTMKEVLARLKGAATSAAGAELMLLLNGRRMAGAGELDGIPPEAIERTEILPEEDAPRFGFPPTVRIINVVTRPHFGAITAMILPGVTTDGGGETSYGELNATRIDGNRRQTLQVSHFRSNPVLQGDRAIAPDPVTRFAIPGNVAAASGGSIDPRLDGLAGEPVAIAAVPADPAQRRMLAGYLAGANRPAITDIGAARTLQPQQDVVKVDGTVAAPVGRAMSGSLNLSMAATRTAGRNGLASAALDVPGGNAALPFDAPVTLYRYLPAVLRQRSTDLTLHGAGVLNGRIGAWMWSATASYDNVRSTARTEQGVPLDALHAAIAAGGDPFAPPGSMADARIVDRSATRTGTATAEVMANGTLLRLPAGTAQVTVTANYTRSTSNGVQPQAGQGAAPGAGQGGGQGAGVAGLDLVRTTRGGTVAVTLPIASASQGVLPILGQLSVNGTAGIADVSAAGRLASVSYGAMWAPLQRLQFSGSIDDTRAPPAIATLTAATLVTPNVPLFDFATGRDATVTVTSGGNPALAPERRRITRLSASLSPLPGADLRLTLSYVTIAERGRNVAPGATALLQAAFPDRFVRDAAGRLVAADLRPVNIAVEKKRKLQLTTFLSAPLGPKPLPTAPETPPSGTRAMLFSSLTGSLRVQDIARPRVGAATIDLLDGGTLDGRGGRPRRELEGTVSVSKGALTLASYMQLQGPTRIRDPLPAADLRFSGRTWILLDARADIAQLVDRPWTRAMTINVTVENILNDRIDVRDATGAVPNRFQPAYLDPLGRSIRLGIRKLF